MQSSCENKQPLEQNLQPYTDGEFLASDWCILITKWVRNAQEEIKHQKELIICSFNNVVCLWPLMAQKLLSLTLKAFWNEMPSLEAESKDSDQGSVDYLVMDGACTDSGDTQACFCLLVCCRWVFWSFQHLALAKYMKVFHGNATWFSCPCISPWQRALKVNLGPGLIHGGIQ